MSGAAATDFDVVALGEAMIEFNQRSPGVFHMGLGGDTSNAAIAAARLGARCAYITRVGDDLFGEALIAAWRAEGVSVDGVAVCAGAPTGVYFVDHGAEGHRFTYRRSGSPASSMRAADVDLSPIARSRFLHVSGISMAIGDAAWQTVLAALDTAEAAGTRISFDVNHRPRLWSVERAVAACRLVLPRAYLVLIGDEEAEQLLGTADADRIAAWALDGGAQHVVVKRGARGCVLVSRASAERFAPLAVHPVDATGAGDCFAGACLALLARGWPLADAVRGANVAAALSTQGFGAVEPLPRFAQLEPYFGFRAGRGADAL